MKYIFLLFASLLVIANTNAQVSVSVQRNPSGTVCEGTQVTFTAVPVNYSTPQYQWYKNGIALPSETNVNYVTSTLTNGDQIYVSLVITQLGQWLQGRHCIMMLVIPLPILEQVQQYMI